AIAFTKRQIPFAGAADFKRSGTRKRNCRERSLIWSRSSVSVSRESRNDSGLRIDAAHTVIQRVAYIKVVGAVECDAVRLVQERFCSRAQIAAVAVLARRSRKG